jgi:hypothetical protein
VYRDSDTGLDVADAADAADAGGEVIAGSFQHKAEEHKGTDDEQDGVGRVHVSMPSGAVVTSLHSHRNRSHVACLDVECASLAAIHCSTFAPFSQIPNIIISHIFIHLL